MKFAEILAQYSVPSAEAEDIEPDLEAQIRETCGEVPPELRILRRPLTPEMMRALAAPEDIPQEERARLLTEADLAEASLKRVAELVRQELEQVGYQVNRSSGQ